MLLTNKNYMDEYKICAFLTKDEIRENDKEYPVTSSKEFIEITDELVNFINESYHQKIPIDMFVSNHIPSKDLCIQFNFGNEETGPLCVKGRVYTASPAMIKAKMIELETKPKMEGRLNSVEIGLIRLELTGKYLIHRMRFMFPIYYAGDDKSTAFTGLSLGCCDDKTYDIFKKTYFLEGFIYKDMSDYAQEVLLAWYTVQTLLLNPVMVPYIKTSNVPIEHSQRSSKKNKKKPPKKYIEKVVLDMRTLDELAISFEKPKYKHKESIWWVSGHFRKYKTGKTVWIDGYWKGPDRLKGTLPEPRERVLPDSSVVNSNINLASLINLISDDPTHFNC